MKKYITTLFLCALCMGINAQEFLVPLKENKALQNAERPSSLERRRAIELPFLDDFYPSGVYPDADLWEDDLVYINATFAVDPPTIGVATFDGLNAKGQPYSILSNAYGVADVLTSLPINLGAFQADVLDTLTSSTGTDSFVVISSENIYLSFFYQEQGLGEAPDADPGDSQNQDYLMVEFKDENDDWDTMWIQEPDYEFIEIIGYDNSNSSIIVDSVTTTAFRKKYVKVSEAKYLHDDFQMRFKSIGRLTGAFDHWHLDYVNIDMLSSTSIVSDTIIQPLIINDSVRQVIQSSNSNLYNELIAPMEISDMAYQYWPTSLLEPYYVMPYNQYDSTYLADTHSVFITNNFIQATTDIIDFYKAELLNTGTILGNYAGPSDDILPDLSFSIDYDKFDIPDEMIDDTVIVRVSYSFQTTAENLTDTVTIRNNSIVKDQVFSNFIAYDDGSAERVFGFIPRPSNAPLGGKTAVKYNINQPDTLRAIKLLFAEYVEESDLPNNIDFSIFVWNSLESDSTSEELLYQQDFINLSDLPLGDSIKTINNFSYIPIKSEFILDNSEQLIVSGDFFIGIGVDVDNVLTIGYDLNTDGAENHFVKFGQDWTPTQNIGGSLMLNPVLGEELLAQYFFVGNNETMVEMLGFSIYPNPTNNYLKVESSVKNGQIEIVDMIGKLVFKGNWNQNGVLDVNELNAGMYMLRLTDVDQGVAGTRQFVKQ